MATTFPRNSFKPLSPLSGGLLSLSLLLSCLGFMLYYYQRHFGASGWVSLAFFVSVLITIGSHGWIVFTRGEPCGPAGLAGSVDRIRFLKRPLIVTLAVVTILWATSALTFFLSARLAGGADSGPLFAPRDVYRLVDHGIVTEVSALRFWIVGVSGALWMLSTCLSFALFALYAVLFGDPGDLWQDPDSKDPGHGAVTSPEPDRAGE